MSHKRKLQKKALITGITGQDGAYLAELLLNKGYQVHGIYRKSSSINTKRIDHLYEEPDKINRKLILHYGDMTDSLTLINIVRKVQPDEIYNLAAQSHVGVSFVEPEYTANTDGLGALRILEAIRILNLEKKTKYYQASSSELYGLAQQSPQNEKTPFYPRSPYAVAKMYAYWITINYREAYGIFACNGILFNHESPVRGETFVSRKISIALAQIKLGLRKVLYLGNLNAKRDWGHAKDYVEAQWLMLQQKKPCDYVIATNKQYSVRDFVNMAAKNLDMKITWKGKNLKEAVYYRGKKIIEIDPKYFRPTEVESLLGDYTKAKKELGWFPKINFEAMVKEMVKKDYELIKLNIFSKKKLKLTSDN